MIDFDVGRIVPSTRDLHAALHTRRSSLALVPLVDAEDVPVHATRLEQIDVRALAVAAASVALMHIARTTRATPLMCLADARTQEDCQRARFYGADGILVVADSDDEYKALSRVAQSMRMMVLGAARSPTDAMRLAGWGARAVVIRGSALDAVAASKALPTSCLLFACIAEVDPDGLRALAGVVDAALVPASVHRSERVSALIAELDG